MQTNIVCKDVPAQKITSFDICRQRKGMGVIMKNFTTAEKDKIYDFVKDDYSGNSGKAKIESGLKLLVKLMNCNVEDQITGDGDESRDIKFCCSEWDGTDTSTRFAVVEGVMKKIVALRKKAGKPLGNITTGNLGGFAEFYCQLGIYAPLEGAHPNITYKKNKKFFEIYAIYSPLGDEAKWKSNCSLPHAMVYILAWQFRNRVEHANPLAEYEKSLAKRSFFTVLIELCLRDKELIETYYSNELENLTGKCFIEWKKQLREKNDRTEFFKDEYTELVWGVDGTPGLTWDDKQKAILLIGEAGAGKTTLMEKLYWDELCAEGEKRLPIWIKIQDLKEKDLLEEIKDRLGDYRNSCDELMEQGYITLYLDGLNELLVADRGKSSQNLVLTIKNMINNYANLRICMTDRTSQRLNQLVKEKKVTVYKCESMDEAHIWDYCIRKWGDERAQMIIDAVSPDDEANEWFWNDERHLVIPEKVNGLGAMVEEKKKPKNKADYYKYYLEHILRREEEEKDDNRIPVLKLLLGKLAEQMEYALDAKYGEDIIELFAGKLNNDYERAQEYFRLACQIPMLVEQMVGEEKKYLFTYYGYYDYFNRKGNT